MAVISADIHLAARTWARYPGLAGDSYYGLKQLVQFCLDNKEDLILAGDLFDKTRPDPATVQIMQEALEIMEAYGLQIYFVQGQHELDRLAPWLNAISAWPTHIHKKVPILFREDTYGLDWLPANQIKQALDEIPEHTRILVAHQVWRDFMGERIGESECAFSDVPHVELLITGDFHRHLIVNTTNKQGRPMRVLSPGPVCMQSIDEDPEKFFFVVNDKLEVTSHKLRTRQCFRFNIDTLEDLELFLSGNVEQAIAPQTGVPENISKNILHIKYKNEIPEIYSRITNAVNNRAHLFMVPIRTDPTVIPIDIQRRRAIVEQGLGACLELLVGKDKPVYADLYSLLQAETNPVEQMKTIKAKFFEKSYHVK